MTGRGKNTGGVRQIWHTGVGENIFTISLTPHIRPAPGAYQERTSIKKDCALRRRIGAAGHARSRRLWRRWRRQRRKRTAARNAAAWNTAADNTAAGNAAAWNAAAWNFTRAYGLAERRTYYIGGGRFDAAYVVFEQCLGLCGHCGLVGR